MATDQDIALTHKYEPFIHTRQHNLFTEEFFSGPDVTITFDGKEIKEISHLTYSVQEQLKPIYGYDSMVFDEVAVGSRIVIGSFVVPIKNEEDTQSPEELYKAEQTEEILPSWIVTDQQKTPVSFERSSGDLMIYNLQRYLIKIGYDIEQTGTLDYETYEAIKDYQIQARINPVGEVTQELILKLQVEAGEGNPVFATEFIAIHVKPSYESRSVGEMQPQTTYVILEEEAEWLLIATFTGLKGYISKG